MNRIPDSPFFDAHFFKSPIKRQELRKDPIILREFHLSLRDGPIGLDTFTQEGSDKVVSKTVWRAWADITNRDWITDKGWKALVDQFSEFLVDEEELLKKLSEGDTVQVLLEGRLRKPPQFMNSDDVPYGLRIHGAMIVPVYQTKKKLLAATDLWYSVASLHPETYLKSRHFLEQYRVQHFIKHVCSTTGDLVPSDRTLDWLVQAYQDQWDDVAKLSFATLQGPTPSREEIVSVIVNHIDNLETWCKTLFRGMFSSRIWKELRRERRRRLQSPRTSPNLEPTSDVEMEEINEVESHFERDASPAPSSSSHLYNSSIDDINMEVSTPPTSISPPPSINPEQKLPRRLQVLIPEAMSRGPPKFPHSLVWHCPCVDTITGAKCDWQLDLIDPSPEVLQALPPDDRHFLKPPIGLPSWARSDERLQNCFYSIVLEHWKNDLRKCGILLECGKDGEWFMRPDEDVSLFLPGSP